jgi:hypothetical protein
MGNSWVSEVVDPLANIGLHNTSLALDSSGHPHITYSHSPSKFIRELKYARWTGSAWSSEVVDTTGQSLSHSLSIDGTGIAHISYFDIAVSALKYAHKNGPTWSVEVVDDQGDVGRYNSLATDSSGQPHIAYYDNSYDALKYAWRSGPTWTIETVDGGGVNVGMGTSLAIDSQGHPQISYYDSDNRDLKHLRWTCE